MSKKRELYIKIYSDYYTLIFGAVYNKISDVHEAEDICHEIFLKLYKNIDNVENPRPWLLAVMRNELANFFRKKRAEAVDIDEITENEKLSVTDKDSDIMIILEDAYSNKQIFPDEYHIILYKLIAFQKYSYKSAAKKIGITTSQSRYKYNQMENKLLDYLKKIGIKGVEDIL